MARITGLGGAEAGDRLMAEIVTESPVDKSLLSPAEQAMNLPKAVVAPADAVAADVDADLAAPLEAIDVPVLPKTPAIQPDDDAENWLRLHTEKRRVRTARHGATAADLGAVGVDPRNVLDDDAFDMVRPHLDKAAVPAAAAANPLKAHQELAMGVMSGAVQEEVGAVIATASRKVAQGYLDVSRELADVVSGWVGGDCYLTWDADNDISISCGERPPDNYKPLTIPKWFSEPTTDAGKIGEGILQFVGNMALLNAGRMGTIPNQWAKWTAIGTVADGLFDPVDGGFASMLLKLDVEPNAVLEFLDPNVTENSTSEQRLVGRFKLMLEGAIPGFGIDIAALLFRAIRAAKNNPGVAKRMSAHLQAWIAARGIKGGEVTIQPGPRTELEGPAADAGEGFSELDTTLQDLEARGDIDPTEAGEELLAEFREGQQREQFEALLQNQGGEGPAASLQGMADELAKVLTDAEGNPYATMAEFWDARLTGNPVVDRSNTQFLRNKITETLGYDFDPRGEFSLEQIIEGVKQGILRNVDPSIVIAQMPRPGSVEEFAQAEKELIPGAPRADADLDEQGFYSAALRASQSMPQQSGKPDQMRGLLLKQLDVKAEELAWTGLDDLFAKAKKEKRNVTAKEIEEHLQNNRVEIEVDETVLVEQDDFAGGFTDPETELRWDNDDTALDADVGEDPDYFTDRASDLVDDIRAEPEIIAPGGWMHEQAKQVLGEWDINTSIDDLYDSQLEEIGEAVARAEYAENPWHRIRDTRHGYEINGRDDVGWTVRDPGGTLLDEPAPSGVYSPSGRVTRHFDHSYQATEAAEEHALEAGYVETRGDYRAMYGNDELTVPGGSNYREMLFKFNSPHGIYASPHWGDGEFVPPGTEPWNMADMAGREEHRNVLAWARVKDREVVMPDGTRLKVLSGEEFQPEWHKAREDRASGRHMPPRYYRMPERTLTEISGEYAQQNRDVLRPIMREQDMFLGRSYMPEHGLGEAEVGHVIDLLGISSDTNRSVAGLVKESPWAGKDHSTPARTGLDSFDPNIGGWPVRRPHSLDGQLEFAKLKLEQLRAYADSLQLKRQQESSIELLPGGPEIQLSEADRAKLTRLEKDVAQLWIWKHIPDDVLARRNALAHEWEDVQRWENTGGVSSYSAREVPDAPFKQMSERGWPKMMMKRLVRYAIENGYDAIAWTTGKTQRDRYRAPEALYDKTIPKVIRNQIIKKHDKDAKIEAVPWQDSRDHVDDYDEETFQMLRFTDKMRDSVKRFGNALFAAPPVAVGAGAAFEQQQQQQQ